MRWYFAILAATMVAAPISSPALDSGLFSAISRYPNEPLPPSFSSQRALQAQVPDILDETMRGSLKPERTAKFLLGRGLMLSDEGVFRIRARLKATVEYMVANQMSFAVYPTSSVLNLILELSQMPEVRTLLQDPAVHDAIEKVLNISERPEASLFRLVQKIEHVGRVQGYKLKIAKEIVARIQRPHSNDDDYTLKGFLEAYGTLKVPVEGAATILLSKTGKDRSVNAAILKALAATDQNKHPVTRVGIRDTLLEALEVAAQTSYQQGPKGQLIFPLGPLMQILRPLQDAGTPNLLAELETYYGRDLNYSLSPREQITQALVRTVIASRIKSTDDPLLREALIKNPMLLRVQNLTFYRLRDVIRPKDYSMPLETFLLQAIDASEVAPLEFDIALELVARIGVSDEKVVSHLKNLWLRGLEEVELQVAGQFSFSKVVDFDLQHKMQSALVALGKNAGWSRYVNLDEMTILFSNVRRRFSGNTLKAAFQIMERNLAAGAEFPRHFETVRSATFEKLFTSLLYESDDGTLKEIWSFLEKNYLNDPRNESEYLGRFLSKWSELHVHYDGYPVLFKSVQSWIETGHWHGNVVAKLNNSGKPFSRPQLTEDKKKLEHHLVYPQDLFVFLREAARLAESEADRGYITQYMFQLAGYQENVLNHDEGSKAQAQSYFRRDASGDYHCSGLFEN